MRVKCLAQEHNTMSPARARTRSAHSGVERTNHEATAPPPLIMMYNSINIGIQENQHITTIHFVCKIITLNFIEFVACTEFIIK